MKIRPVWIGIIVLAMSWLLIGCTQMQTDEKSYRADRFDSIVAIEKGGSLSVTETIAFDFIGGPFTFVFRELPLDHTDGITVLEASVDGAVYPEGENPGQVEISSGDPMRITWHLEPTSDRSHTVQLTYRVAGAVRQEAGADLLNWQPLPDSYDYFIGESETVIGYPATTALVAEPTIAAGAANVQQAINQVIFTAQDLQPDTPLVVSLRFEENSLITGPPTWQAEQQAIAERLPYWLGLAVLLFAAGLTGMVVVWRRQSASIDGKGVVMVPPDDLSPALAGALLTQGEPKWNQAQATIYQLAEQGVLNIEELPEKKWNRKHDFALNLIDPKTYLLPHQEGLLDMLFGENGGRTSTIKLSKMSKKVTGAGWKRFKEPLKAEIEAAGFLSKSRQRARSIFFGSGIVLLVLGVIGIITLSIWGRAFGFGPLAVAIAVMLLGIAGMLLGSALAPLSDVGATAATAWKRFSNYLKEVTKGKQSLANPKLFEDYLAYAAAFGMTKQWTKQSEKEGWTEIPAYLQLSPGTTGMEGWMVFIYMQSAVNSSGGSASGAGAAGGGSAGGGSSGAG